MIPVVRQSKKSVCGDFQSIPVVGLSNRIPTICLVLDAFHFFLLPSSPSYASIGKPHNRSPLESNTNGFYWKASQQEYFGKHNEGIRLESLTNRNALESATHRFYWIASQQESFEKHNKRIQLGSLTKGILWKTPGRGSIGSESATQGFYWQASQHDFFG